MQTGSCFGINFRPKPHNGWKCPDQGTALSPVKGAAGQPPLPAGTKPELQPPKLRPAPAPALSRAPSATNSLTGTFSGDSPGGFPGPIPGEPLRESGKWVSCCPGCRWGRLSVPLLWALLLHRQSPREGSSGSPAAGSHRGRFLVFPFEHSLRGEELQQRLRERRANAWWAHTPWP